MTADRLELLGRPPQVSAPRRVLGRLAGYARRDPIGAVAVAVMGAFILLAVAGPWITPDDPLSTNVNAILAAPGTHGHLFGTDQLGRDTLSRLLAGTRPTLVAAVGSLLVGAAVGMVIGIVAGYVGGRADEVLMRLMDVLLAFPGLILALAIAAALGPGVRTLIIALAIPSIPAFARVIRQESRVVSGRAFVESAVAIGATPRRVMWLHVFPNVVPILVIMCTTRLSFLILLESTLSYLGVGIRPPAPDWGTVIADGASHLVVSQWQATIGGAVVFVCVLAVNIAGDSVRDALDPRLRRQ
ncbi:MAG TPA: ABC transporter permease [Pirellulales bacterium]|nr:ABC transporter permease [Pirellulales bacterium]